MKRPRPCLMGRFQYKEHKEVYLMIVITHSKLDKLGIWRVEGEINGVGFSGMAETPHLKGINRFRLWPDDNVAFLPAVKQLIAEKLNEEYKRLLSGRKKCENKR